MRSEVLASSLSDYMVSSYDPCFLLSLIRLQTRHTLFGVGGRDVLGGVSDLYISLLLLVYYTLI